MVTTASVTGAEIAWAVEAFTLNTEGYAKARKYYHGQQELAFATPKFNKTFGPIYQAFAYNRCRSVVDALANSLKVKSFQVNGVDITSLAITAENDETAGTGTEYGKQAGTLWRLGQMDRREGEIYVEAGITGDAYGVIWFDSPPPFGTGLPRLWPQKADVMRVKYDDDARIILGAKSWLVRGGLDDKKRRLTLYTATEIVRLITVGQAEAELPKDEAAYQLVAEVNGLGQSVLNPVPHALGRPPVVHYANNAPMQGDFGISELADVIPLQDALNKTITDMLVAMEYAGYRQRWAVGIGTPELDDNGKPIIPFREGPGELWYTTDKDASFGSFDATDLKQFDTVSEGFDMKIARVSGTPVHWLIMTGTPPSGESIKTASAQFTKKIQDRQKTFGGNHAEATAMKFGLMGVTDPMLIDVEWESAEPRSEREQAEIGKIMSDAGIPLHIAARVMGLDEQDLLELEAIEEEKAASREQAMAQISGQAMQGQLMQPPAGDTVPEVA